MSRFVENANLPGKADSIIIGEKYTQILSKPLSYLGIKTILMPDNPFVDPRLSGHTDLSVFHAGGDSLLLAPHLRDTEFSRQLESRGAKLCFADIAQGPLYPADAQLNAALIENRLIYCKKVTNSKVLELVKSSREVLPIFVKQGYVNCSICIVDKNSIITSDCGIAEECKKSGMDVLLISPGHFVLDGFDCGFIGGCAFKLSSDSLAFTGSINMHPDKDRILSFLHSHYVNPTFLTDLPAFDIGGAIPITEKTA